METFTQASGRIISFMEKEYTLNTINKFTKACFRMARKTGLEFITTPTGQHTKVNGETISKKAEESM